MQIKRREFIRITGAASAGMAVAAFAGTNLLGCFNDEGKKTNEFGLQLWTIRDAMVKDPKGTLQQVAAMGYKHVESFEGSMGMFWGMKNTEFKKFLSGIGMTMHSSHFGGEEDFEKKVADAAEIGLKYLAMAWEGPGKTIDDYKKLAELSNKRGEICKQHGIRYAFHNHDFTFRPLEGQFAEDVLLTNTDASLVDFEMDIYWVVTAGQDPEKWFKKYPNRFRLCHIKDRTKTPVIDNGQNSIDLGTGTIDFKKVLKTARENGMQYYIVEQEAYPNGTSMQAIKVDADYMKILKF